MSDLPDLHCTICDETFTVEEVDEVEVTESSGRYKCPECGETKFKPVTDDENSEEYADPDPMAERRSKVERKIQNLESHQR